MTRSHTRMTRSASTCVTQQTAESSTGSPERYIMQLNVDLNETQGGRALEQHVHWTPETEDNEMLNRKKTKICCIYHHPHEFGDSSSESDGSSCDSRYGSNPSHRSEPKKKPCRFVPPSDSAPRPTVSESAP